MPGHAGHETADYTVENLPDLVKEALSAVLEADKEPAPSTISETLIKAISSFDDNIGRAFLELFPDQESLARMSDEEIKSIINDGGSNAAIVVKCLRGTTVLIAISDPAKANLWVASLGDCSASTYPFVCVT